MKTLIIFCVAAIQLLGSYSAAAASCKYIEPHSEVTVGGKNEQARLLSAPARWTSWKAFRSFANQSKNHGWLNGMIEGEKKYLGLKITLVEERNSVPKQQDLIGHTRISAGARLLVLLKDESIVELFADSEIIGTSTVGMPGSQFMSASRQMAGSRQMLGSENSVSTTMIVRYELNDDTLEALSVQGATDMRLSLDSGDVDFSFGKKASNRIQKALECIA